MEKETGHEKGMVLKLENAVLNVVIIARRNTSLSILHALNSILNQIYSPIKIQVVDANEPNSIYSLGLQEDLAAYAGVEYLQMDQFLSLAEIRNYILYKAEGEYIAFLRSNDAWDSNKAFLQIEQLKSNANVAASCSDGVLIDKRKQHIVVEPLLGNTAFNSDKWVLDNPAKMSAQVIYRTQAVREAGGFDGEFENFCDGDMLLRLTKNYKVMVTPVPLCECAITPEEELYDLNNFRDGQKILYKYMDFFLVNKQMTQIFYLRMIHLAKTNFLWLNYFGYIIMYCLKTPGSMFYLLFQALGKLLKYVLKWLRRTGSLFFSERFLTRDINLIRKGKLGKIKALKVVEAIGKKEEEEEIPIQFTSARRYNEKKSLDFVFDRKLTSIVIPEYVTVIKKSMFYGCHQLVSVEIPNTVLEIQAHAFQNCKKLRHVTLKEGSRLGKIGAYAFAGCSSLETISLTAGLVSIGQGAFAECSALRQLQFTYMHGGTEKSTKIFPSAIVKLHRYTFAGCSSLLAVEFGADSMLEIVETGAFMGCVKLQKILLTGKVVTVDSYAFAYCKRLETAAFPHIDTLKYMGSGVFTGCEALAYFQLPNQIERIYERTFYGCASLKLVKIPKKVISINHQAFAKCNALERAIILTGDIAISPTAFDKHTEVRIQENEDRESASEWQ
ncbi:leucine-rich repeat protein [Anaerocolumna sp. AGMB13020]|uniref:leucine-rich repeat protein n=1 Tax=Anaerocolumna sp. AGMB13020 TaxID=3081750 RepID=UPI0029535B04|nr:leucine-rich repeat protein [Anaerocolumna sp. AGMB13020]WOO36700.1 leucine-rich repeat protein [Anaerocolumna sp. AGMB13020]